MGEGRRGDLGRGWGTPQVREGGLGGAVCDLSAHGPWRTLEGLGGPSAFGAEKLPHSLWGDSQCTP